MQLMGEQRARAQCAPKAPLDPNFYSKKSTPVEYLEKESHFAKKKRNFPKKKSPASDCLTLLDKGRDQKRTESAQGSGPAARSDGPPGR